MPFLCIYDHLQSYPHVAHPMAPWILSPRYFEDTSTQPKCHVGSLACSARLPFKALEGNCYTLRLPLDVSFL